MTTTYNKYEEGSLVGNWVEEHALKEVTGVSRYQTWTEEKPGTHLIITKELGVGKNVDTAARTMVHTERTESKDYESAQHDAHNPGKYAAAYAGRPALGPRAARFAAQFQAETKAEVEEAAATRPAEPPTKTAAQEAFAAYPEEEYTSLKGRRVMKSQEGKDLPYDCRDNEFLRAAGISQMPSKLSKDEVARLSKDLHSGQAVSIYSQRRGEGAYVGTAATSANPFGRNAGFTNDIEDARLSHYSAQDDITRRPKGVAPAATTHVGSVLSEHDALTQFRTRVRKCVGAGGLQRLKPFLHRYDSSGDGQLNYKEFSAALADLRIDATPREMEELIAYFDVDHSGRVTVQELYRGLTGDLNSTRASLVEAAYRSLSGGQAQVPVQAVVRRYDAAAHPEVADGKTAPADALDQLLGQLDETNTGVVTRDQFVQYYRDVSSLLEDDAEFESHIRSAWRLKSAGGAGRDLLVEVRHPDATTETVTVPASAGVNANDTALIKALLRKMGVRNVHSVRVTQK